MNKIYVGIGAKARQGKDTLARMLHAYNPHNSRIIGFADALKSYARVQHGMTVKDGPLLQRVGVEMRESRGENFWIDVLRHTAEEATERVIIVADMRFPNEAEFIRSQGGTLVKVSRIDPRTRQLFVTPDRDPNHISETALDGYKDWNFQFPCDSLAMLQDAAARLDFLLRGKLRYADAA